LPIATDFESNEEPLACVAGDPDGREEISRDQATFDALTATPAVSAPNGAINGQSRGAVLRRKRLGGCGEQRHRRDRNVM
jgi:hypothetical protein